MLKYTQAYTMFKEMIADGRLRRGDRMPSIRRAAELYRISRTTVQNAYFQLAAEGYIYAKPQSGYFVAGGANGPPGPPAPGCRHRLGWILPATAPICPALTSPYGSATLRVPCASGSGCSLTASRRESTTCGAPWQTMCGSGAMWSLRRNILW